MSAIVAIVGRPNVGKSTLFNRMIQKREAIVDAVSGVTRDRHYGKSDWNGVEFSLIDTGGYVVGSEDIFEQEIDRQVELAIDEADAIIFMVEVETGLTGMDEEVAQLLRKSKKTCFSGSKQGRQFNASRRCSRVLQLRIRKNLYISGINGSGTGELLDDLVKSLLTQTEETGEELPVLRLLVAQMPENLPSLTPSLAKNDTSLLILLEQHATVLTPNTIVLDLNSI